LNGTHQLLVYADYVNVLSEYINIIKRKAEALLHGSREAGIEVNTRRSKNIVTSLPKCRIKSQFTEI
jgi:hypothetical protein